MKLVCVTACICLVYSGFFFKPEVKKTQLCHVCYREGTKPLDFRAPRKLLGMVIRIYLLVAEERI